MKEFNPILAPYEIAGTNEPTFIIPNDFLIKYWEDYMIWDGCPHIVNENVIDCIKELKSVGQYPYNSTVGNYTVRNMGFRNIKNILYFQPLSIVASMN